MSERPSKPNKPAPKSKRVEPSGQAPSAAGKATLINSHKDLAAKTPEIVAKLDEDPELAKAMFLNPAAAIKEAGYDLSPEIVSHITDTIRHSASTTKRRAALEKTLQEALAEAPQPQDPKWLARILFERLAVAPIDTKGLEPSYVQAFSAGALARLQKLRPKLRKRDVKTPLPQHGTQFKVALIHPSPRRWDFDAKLPDAPRLSSAPETVDLRALYFYKDAHPLVRPLLELGLIRRSTFPLQSADSYRKIRRGEKPSPLSRWVKQIRFQKS
jgi:hypothetical protein